MLPKSELYKKLPYDLILILSAYFNPNIFEKIINSYRKERNTTFRINNLKSNKNEVIKILRKKGYKFNEYNLIKDAFVFDRNIDKEILKEELVSDGKIYIQSISSMLPAIILEPKPGEKILDLAAAPGSKTSHIASITNNLAFIDAVEPDFIRFEKLKHNMNLLGVKNINLINKRGETYIKEIKEIVINGSENKFKDNFCEIGSDKINLDKEFEIYDKILIDAPCSGEGRVSLFDKDSYNFYNLRNIKKFQKLQYKLISESLNILKKGGILVYSTCTLNPYENELIIDMILNEYNSKIKIEKVEQKFYNLRESINKIENIYNIDILIEYFSENKNKILKNKENLAENLNNLLKNISIDKEKNLITKINNSEEINNCLKIIPSDIFEGFFICKIRKL